MHIGAAGFHADFAQHGNRAVAHDLVFLVGEGQGGGDGDAVAGMHAHGIDVLDCADDDAVVGGVADHLHLEFFPTEQGFIDKDLRHGRGFKTRAADRLEIVSVIGDAAAGAAKGKGGADDRGQADVFDGLHRLADTGRNVIFARGQFGGGDDGGLGVFQPDAVHRLAEQLAILGHLNRGAFGPDQLDVEFGQHAHIIQSQRGVQPGLTAHGRQYRVGALFFDDFGDNLGGDRFDIGGVGQAGVGHDGGGVGVYQDDAVALFAQGFAGLRARVVKLAGLSDHDGPGSDDHDGFDIGSFWHGGPQKQNFAGYSEEGPGCKGLSGIGWAGITRARNCLKSGGGFWAVERLAENGGLLSWLALAEAADLP